MFPSHDRGRMVKMGDDLLLFLDHDADDVYLYQRDASNAWTLLDSELNIFNMSGYPSGSYGQEEGVAYVWAGNNAGIQRIYKVTYNAVDGIQADSGIDVGSHLYMAPICVEPGKLALLSSGDETLRMWDYDTDTIIGSSYSLPAAIAGKLDGDRLADLRS